MLLSLLLIPFLFVILTMVGKWRGWLVLGFVLPLLLIQAILLWWLPVAILVVWAQSLQLLILFTLAVVLMMSEQKGSSERLMGQVYFSLFSFFSLAVLLMPALWQQAAMALVSLLVLVMWFASQRQSRIHLGVAMIGWFYTIIAMAMQLHMIANRAHSIGILLMAIALLGMIIFYYYRFWLSLWFFCFHLGLALLLLWAPAGSSGLAVLLHISFFLVALMFVTIVQYIFRENDDELLEYENGTMITLGFWRALGGIARYIPRFRGSAHVSVEDSKRPAYFSLAHGLLFMAVLMIWCMPPSVLFLTMFLVLSQIIAVFAANYIVLILLSLAFVIFTVLGTKRLLVLWLQAWPMQIRKSTKVLVSIYALVLLMIVVGANFWLPDQLMDALQKIGDTLQV